MVSPPVPASSGTVPAMMTVVYLSLATDRIRLFDFPAEVAWPIAAQTILGSHSQGELQLLGAVPGRISLAGDAAQLPLGPPARRPSSSGQLRWFTVFGFDWAAAEGIAQVALAREWISAAHAILRIQPKSFQLAGIADGAHAWLPNATWQDLLRETRAWH